MNNQSYLLCHISVIICLYHFDVGASIIRQRIGFAIGRGFLKRNHFLVDHILKEFLEVDVMVTLEWVSPKWGSMVKRMVVGSEVPLTNSLCFYEVKNKEFLVTSFV